jgi:hypothetical protein
MVPQMASTRTVLSFMMVPSRPDDETQTVGSGPAAFHDGSATTPLRFGTSMTAGHMP